jgi:hypothetical protein
MEEDPGKWLPFAIDLGTINCVKLATDDVDQLVYNCSTLYTSTGDMFIVDTPYSKMVDIWQEYTNDVFGSLNQDPLTDEEGGDLDL